MTLLVLCGLPGVGKPTIGREVAGITGYRLFHLHLLVDMIGALFDFGSAGFRDLRDMLLPQIIRRAAVAEGPEALSGVILTMMFESTVNGPWYHGISADVEQAGGRVVLVELTCTREQHAARLASPERRQFKKLVSVPLFEEIRAAGHFRMPDSVVPDLVIDTTKLGPRAAAQHIVRFLRT